MPDRAPRPPAHFASVGRLSAAATPFLGLTALAVALAASGGCGRQAAEPSREAAEAREAQRKATQSGALLESIVSQLRSLPEAVALELRPPTVLLDARSTTDGEDAEAAIRRRPEAPDEPANLLVAGPNVRFRALGVGPGDTVKFFGAFDRETLERLRETGEADIVTFSAVPLTVAQTIDDTRLLIAGGLAEEVSQPRRIEVWRNVDDRMEAIDAKLGRYFESRDPPLGWQPTPDETVLDRMTERLNQWLRQSGRRAAVAAPPTLLGTLDASLRDDDRLAGYLTDEEIASGVFRIEDARAIQQAVWCRDIGLWARGDDPTVSAQAAALFDWVVRHVRLVDPTSAAPHRPWETLVYGRGTAEQRAWVFLELCRQQNLPAAAVLVPGEGGGARTLVGVVDAPPAAPDREKTGQGTAAGPALRLFDPALGLALPSSEEGAVGSIAELADNDELLRTYDLEGAPYPVTSEALRGARLAVCAEPFQWTHRARTLGSLLTGVDQLALWADIDSQAERLAPYSPQAGKVTLWDVPIRTLREKLTANRATRAREVRALLPLAWRPHLWKARVLHFRGRVEEQRPGGDALAEPIDDLRAAQKLYVDPAVRPTDKLLARVASADKREIYSAAKTLATYWLATLLIDRGDGGTALDWLNNRAVEPSAGATAAGLADAVRYARARACELAGQTDRAIKLLEGSAGPQRDGDRLRARMLRRRADADADTDTDTDTDEGP